MPVIAAARLVQHGTIVPHDKHVGLPLVPVDELVLSLVMIDAEQQVIAGSLVHALEALDVSNG